MPQIKLTWEYDNSGPLPTVVEVLRDNVVIETFNSPVTEYIDDVAGTENVTYFIKSKYGSLEAISDNVVVSFVNTADYEFYWHLLPSDVIDGYIPVDANGRELILDARNSDLTNKGLNVDNSAQKDKLVSPRMDYADTQSFNLNGNFTIEFKIESGKTQLDENYVFSMIDGSTVWTIRTNAITGEAYLRILGADLITTTGVNVLDGFEHKVIFQRTDDILDCFVDGELVNSTPWFGETSADNATIAIGGWATESGFNFEGYIRDFGFAKVALYG